MSSSPAQPDLFGSPAASGQADLFASASSPRAANICEPPPADFIDTIRRELQTSLARVCAAERLPWRDYTEATLAEMRFNSISAWLPDAEAASLRQQFGDELDRLSAGEV